MIAEMAMRVPSYLILRVRGQSRAFPIRSVCDVAQADAVERVPDGPGWIPGVVSSVWGRVPVVDLAVRTGQPPTPLDVSSCVVIVEVTIERRTIRVGLLADEGTRVTSARLPRWAVLSVDELLDYGKLRDASDPGPDEARTPALRPGSSRGGVSGSPRPAFGSRAALPASA